MASPFTSNTANFGSGDIGAQQEALRRNQMLAQMLNQQASEPLQQMPTPSGGFAVPVSPWQTYAKIMEKGLNAYTQYKMGDKEKEFNEEKAQKISDALGNWDKLRTGTPGSPAVPESTRTMPIGDSNGPASLASETTPGAPAVPATAPNPRGAWLSLLNSGVPELQQTAMQGMLSQKGPESMFAKVDPKDYTQDSVAKFAQTQNFADLTPVRKMDVVNGVAANLFDTKPGTVFPIQGNPRADLLTDGPDGTLVLNKPLFEAKKALQKAGAPNVNVKTDVKMGESLGAQVGPIMKESSTKAMAAVKTINTAQNLRKILMDGNVITGPLANQQLQVDSVLNKLGFGGKTREEKLANTRSLMMGTGQFVIQGRQEMQGQGPVSDYDSRLVERAASGDLTLTPPELMRVFDVAEDVARFQYADHQRKMDALSADPNVSKLAPYYQAPPLPPAMKYVAPPPPAGSRPRPSPTLPNGLQSPMGQPGGMPPAPPRRRAFNPQTGGFD